MRSDGKVNYLCTCKCYYRLLSYFNFHFFKVSLSFYVVHVCFVQANTVDDFRTHGAYVMSSNSEWIHSSHIIVTTAVTKAC